MSQLDLAKKATDLVFLSDLLTVRFGAHIVLLIVARVVMPCPVIIINRQAILGAPSVWLILAPVCEGVIQLGVVFNPPKYG